MRYLILASILSLQVSFATAGTKDAKVCLSTQNTLLAEDVINPSGKKLLIEQRAISFGGFFLSIGNSMKEFIETPDNEIQKRVNAFKKNLRSRQILEKILF